MNSLTRQSVVDRLAADLQTRRTAIIGRKSAYLALARAILNDEISDLPIELAFARVTSIPQIRVAA